MPNSNAFHIVTANDLLCGDVVFMTAGGAWSRALRHAAVARSEQEAAALLSAAEADESTIVGPYLAEVALDEYRRPVLLHYRERLRLLGPSNRLDLGRQAQPQSAHR